MHYEILEYMGRDTDIVLHLSSRDWYVLEKSPIWAELEKEVDRIQSKRIRLIHRGSQQKLAKVMNKNDDGR